MRIGENRAPRMVTPACSVTEETTGKRCAQKTKTRKETRKRAPTKKIRRKATRHRESEYETDSEDEVASQFEHMTLDVITMASIDKETEIDEKRDEAYTYIEVKRDGKMIADV